MKSASNALFIILIALGVITPALASAQTVDASTTPQRTDSQIASLMAQVQSLQQELASILAALRQIAPSATAQVGSPATTSVQSAFSSSGASALPAGVPSACGLSAYVTALMADKPSCVTGALQPSIGATPFGSVPGDAANLLSQALAGSLALQPSVGAAISAATSAVASSSATASEAASQAPSVGSNYSDVVNRACATDGTTVDVTGGYSCIGPICMPVPSSTLQCRGGTWQTQASLGN